MSVSDLNIRIGARLDQFSSGIDAAERKLKAFARRAESVGQDLTTRLTLPIVGIGAAAVSAFANFEKVENGLKAVAGSTQLASDQLERLREIAKNPGIELEEAVKGSIRLQTVGFAAREAEQVLLQLSKAVTVAGGSAEDLGEVTRQFAQITSKGKILTEDINVIRERIPAIGLAFQDAFGTQSVDAIRASGIGTREFVARLTEAISKNQVFQSATGGVSNELNNFTNSIKQSGVQFGRAIVESTGFVSILSKLSGFISRASEGFANLSPGAQKFIVFSAAGAAALGPLLFGLGAMAKTLPLITTGIAALKIAVTAFTSPIGIAVVAIAGLVYGFRELYKNNEGFRTSIQGLVSSFLGLGRVILDVLSPAFSFVRSIIGTVGAKLTDLGINSRTVSAFFAGFATAIVDSISSAARTLSSFVSGLKNLISGEFTAAGQNFKTALTENINFLTGKTIGEGFNRGFSSALSQTTPPALPVPPKEEVFNFSKFVGDAVSRDVAAGITTGIQSGAASSGARGQSFALNPIQSTALSQLDTSSAELANQGLILSNEALAASFVATARAIQPTQGILTTLGEQYDLLDAKAIALGAGFDAAKARIDLTREALVAALDAGFGPTSTQVVFLSEQLGVLEESYSRVSARNDALAAGITSLGSSFSQLAEDGKLSFKAFAKAAVDSIGDIIGALIQQAVARVIANSALAGGPVGIALAAAAGTAASGIFKGLISRITPFADGGLVTGPTLGLVGEAGPELIIPLAQIGDLFPDQGSSQGEFVLRGDDLLLILQRAEKRQTRIF